MFSSSLRHAWRHTSALVLVSLFAVVPARGQQPQPTARDSSKSKMPMNMQMGTSIKKKKPASSAKSTSSTAAKKKSRAKVVAKTRSSAKKRSPTMAMPMPSKSAPKPKSAPMAGMQMGAHPPATHGDTTQAKMGAMDVQRMPSAAKDSAHMNMPNMPSNPDSAHMNAPGMAGMPGMPGDKRDSTPGAMKGMQPGMRAQASMDPYVTAITTPLDKRSVMLMVLPDFQVARFGRNFSTGMLMAEYGLTSRLTVGAMAEGQKVGGLPATYGGLRYNAYFHLFRGDRLLNLTLYGEYEDLNGAALYKMEVAGFGPEDLTEPLALARNTPVRTFEQRVIVYHDWVRLNATFNFIRETALQAPRGSDYGYALGLFFRPSVTSGSMTGMAGMSAPSALSMSRLGYGLEMIGALGDNQRFGFYWNAQQHYLGPVLTYALSSRSSLRLEPAFGLSNVSDPFVLRMGMAYMLAPSGSKPAP